MVRGTNAVVKPFAMMIEIEDAFIAHSAMLCTRTDPGVTNSTMELELLCHSF